MPGAAGQPVTDVVTHDHGALPGRGRPYVPVRPPPDWGQIRFVKIGANGPPLVTLADGTAIMRQPAAGERIRISYWIASGRRIIALTVFAKTKMRETAEIARAAAAMARCRREGHTADEEG